jgi:glycosyltransferase involved in cell wall biosynthesis
LKAPLFLRRIWRWLTPHLPRKTSFEKRVDYLRSYVAYEPSDVEPPFGSLDLSRLRITWVIPDFMPGGGGHMTIFRLASYLERFGHDVRFLIQNPIVHTTPEAACAAINKYFLPFSGPVELFKGHTPNVEGDVLIATDRFTCYPVNAMNGFIRKFYLVQDFEPAFYPAGAEALLSAATYEFDFDCLCAGDWLHDKMSQEYGRWSMSWPLAYDASVYNLGDGSEERASAKIAVYARYVTPRRAVELAFMALEVLWQRGVRFEVDFFGWPLGKLNVSFPYQDCGVLSGPELAQLYRQSTIGVVFSATNHSLVNKEMMACGLPVIDLDLDTVRSIFPVGSIRFAHPSVESIADAMEHLLREPQERDRQRQRALDYVQGLSWEQSARLIEAAIKERVAEQIQGQAR